MSWTSQMCRYPSLYFIFSKASSRYKLTWTIPLSIYLGTAEVLGLPELILSLGFPLAMKTNPALMMLERHFDKIKSDLKRKNPNPLKNLANHCWTCGIYHY